METQKTVTIRATTREDYHKQLIMLFLEEQHGNSEEWNYYDYCHRNWQEWQKDISSQTRL